MSLPGSRTERLTAPPAPPVPSRSVAAAAPRVRPTLGESNRTAWLFLAPALLLIAVFFFLPVAASLLLSVTDFDIYAIAS
ncbi:MAG TPA: hypothetical protein VGR27_11290, partial [Longimicrobiaceae bacterium]|nr:hypothetical protein [Longimicrobiaceae bacterium]